MRKILLRTISLILALLFVLATFAACKKDDEEETETDTVSTDGLTNIPDNVRFEGETLKFLVPTDYHADYNPDEGQTGIIDEAVRRTKLLTEERFGYTIEYILDDGKATTELQQNIQSSIMAGDGAYDLIANIAHASIGHIIQGYYYNYNNDNEYNYVNMKADWYNREFVKNITYKNKIFAAVGDATISFTDRAPVMFYNEDALKEYQITDDLIQQVVDGKWTIDYLKTLIQGVYKDVDGDGKQDKDDFYGLFYNNGSMCNDAQIYAAGIRITKKNADGDIKITWKQGTAVDAFEAVYDLAYNSTGVFRGTIDLQDKSKDTYYGSTTNYYSEQAFFEKRAMFAYGMLSAAKTYALDPTLQYGILPIPKYSEQQEYSTTPQNGYLILAVPYNAASRLGIATATVEALSEYSYRELRPVYYETAYKVRYASSATTGELFDMIIDSMGIDFGSFYNTEMGKPVELLRNRLDGMNGITIGPSLTGVTAQFEGAMERSLQDLITKLEEIE